MLFLDDFTSANVKDFVVAPTSLSMTKDFIEKWHYSKNVNGLTISQVFGLFYESKILLIWTKNQRFRLMLGYKITYGEYPYGAHWQIIPPKLPTFSTGWPLLDIQISW